MAVNKMDVTEARARWEEVRARFEDLGLRVYPMSAATGEGVQAVLGKAADLLAQARAAQKARPMAEVPTHVLRPRVPATDFQVVREGAGFRVVGAAVERIVAMTDLESEESLAYLQRILARLGVAASLEAAGVKPGDTVRFGNVELEWV